MRDDIPGYDRGAGIGTYPEAALNVGHQSRIRSKGVVIAYGSPHGLGLGSPVLANRFQEVRDGGEAASVNLRA